MEESQMRKSKALFGFLLICALLPFRGLATFAARPEQSFQNINIALQAVRQTRGILTGLEIPTADEANKSPISFDPSGNDLAHVFDLLVAGRPAYAWNLQDGVYDVYPRQQAESLAQLNVSAFVLTNSTLDEAQAALFDLPEVKAWLSAHRAARGGGGAEHSGLGPGPAGPFPQPKRVSLSLANVKLYNVLNQLITKFGRAQWIIDHVPAQGQFTEYVSIEP
jgi:hypothetical protein